MADVELLPLPEPGMLHVGEPREWFTADQMHAYSDARVAQATEPLRAEVEALRAEVELWRHKAAVHQYRRERLAEALRLIESAKDRGFGIDYARGVAQSALLRDQEEDHEQ